MIVDDTDLGVIRVLGNFLGSSQVRTPVPRHQCPLGNGAFDGRCGDGTSSRRNSTLAVRACCTRPWQSRWVRIRPRRPVARTEA
jgi:hypothetical protein